MLATSFFLPAVETCRRPDYPCQLLWDCVRDLRTEQIEELFFWPVVLLGPYLFGLLSLVVALRPIRESGGQRRSPGFSIAVLLGCCALSSLIGIVIGLVKGYGWEVELWVAAVLVAISWVYWIRGVRGGFFGILGIRWYASLCCILWYIPWSFSEGGRFGVRLSLLGSALICIGSLNEAALRTFAGIFPTIGRLAICRWPARETEGPRCPNCGYSLIGLTSNRCPECGVEFPGELVTALAASGSGE